MEKNKEEICHEKSWFKHYWRPAIAWQYFVVCLFDFIIAPVLTAFYAALVKITYIPWDPITLKETGLYHIAMGAILGVSAWSRGKEKIAKIEMEEPIEDEKELNNKRKYKRFEEH